MDVADVNVRIAGLVRAGALGEAEAQALDACRRWPGDAESRQWLGCVLLLRGRGEEACEHLALAFRLGPEKLHIRANYLEGLLQCGRLTQVSRVLDELSAGDPAWGKLAFFRARLAMAEGNWADAAAIWQALALTDAGDPVLRQRWVECCEGMGDWPAAVEVWRQLLPLLPESRGEVLCNLGNALLNAGEVDEAQRHLQAAIEYAPRLAPAWLNWGRLLSRVGRRDEAREAYRQACELAPEEAGMALAWGQALLADGMLDFPDFLRSTVKALSVRVAGAALLLARRDSLAGDDAAARRGWRNALSLPDCSPAQAAEAWINLGQQALNEKDLPEARRCLEAALRCQPGNPLACYNLGLCRHLADDYAGAVEAYSLALAADAEGEGAVGEMAAWRPALLGNLGRAYFDLRDLRAARACLERAGAATATGYRLFGNYVDTLTRLADWTSCEKLLQARSLPDGQASWPESVNPFSALALSDDPELHWRSARAYALEAVPQAQPWRAGRAIPTTRRLRIGYLSSDLHAHATAYLLVDVLASHQRQQVEVFAYSYGPDDGSPMRRRVQAAVEHFRDLAGVKPRDMAAAIRRDGIDILVDLKAYTHRALPEVLASRPAPIQVNWLGFPGLMATPAVDYILVDHFIHPGEKMSFSTVDREYGEFPLRLSRCYQPADREQTVGEPLQRGDWGLPATGFVFASFNQVYKLTREVFTLWCRIVAACPRSVLWLFEPAAEAKQALLDCWTAHGLAPERLIWAPVVPHAGHLARLQHADLLLDTFPYGAHTTASDALRQGVPVLTRAGRSFPSRVAGSLLWHLGLDELICADWEAYSSLAVRLHAEPDLLISIQARLRQAMPRLLDAPGFAAELESVYAAMAERHRRGLPPGECCVR